jgi:hypothetical protein
MRRRCQANTQVERGVGLLRLLGMADAAGGGSEAATTDTLLAFLTTSCAECQPFWEMMAGSAAIDDLGARLVVVTPSRSMENERLARGLVPEGVHLHMGSETWFEYGPGRKWARSWGPRTSTLPRTFSGS